MPAIDIARLKIQTATLLDNFDQPSRFVEELHEILELYADRTIRPTVVAPASVLPAYRASRAVLRHIEQELAPLALTFAPQTLALIDALWQDGWLETRLLASSLLGKISPQTPGLTERLTAWVEASRDATLRQNLLEISPQRLSKEQPALFLDLLQGWLSPSTSQRWGAALQAMNVLLQDPAYENLPPLFDLFQPVLQVSPAALQTEITQTLTSFYRASPIETTYFLKKTLQTIQRSAVLTVLRRVAPGLPGPLQQTLLQALRQKTAVV